jgi:hypothetical protein
MPCGARARLTAYVSYRMVAFAEREVLLTALADLGFTQVEIASFPTETTNPIPVVDASGSVVGTGALVVRRHDLKGRLADLGFVLRNGVYEPLLPADSRSDLFLASLRTAYGRAKADQLAEQTRRRYQASVKRQVAPDGTVTVRVRF